MTEKILLGDIELEAAQIINLTEKATVPEKKVEAQFSIVDHVILNPAEFSIDAVCIRDSQKHIKLKQLYESKKPVTFHSDLLGTYDNMIIESLDFSQGGSVNTIKASVHIKQIKIAESKTVTISLPVTPMIREVPQNTTAKPPKDKHTQYEPEKQENKSWLDSIFDWLGGVLGG
ncbi:hypothetical protein DRP05_08605 [Archaeoglobales archaeon]|nr:MAG: hypothetical protein DRP05_08605 [Archaeoglobales archaeon]